ncbi:MAG: hypothetical protein CMH49_07100, partial [Myxococcales bacterium]|nr:hypothetical protein [Myxococcales bacterium]
MKNIIRLFSMMAIFSLLSTQALWADDYEFEDDVAEVSEADETALSEDELAQILAEEGLIVDSTTETKVIAAEAPKAEEPKVEEPKAEEPK